MIPSAWGSIYVAKAPIKASMAELCAAAFVGAKGPAYKLALANSAAILHHCLTHTTPHQTKLVVVISIVVPDTIGIGLEELRVSRLRIGLIQ